MLNWLRNLFSRCNHEWEVHQQINHRDGGEQDKPIVGIIYVLRCTKCGDMKNHKVYT